MQGPREGDEAFISGSCRMHEASSAASELVDKVLDYARTRVLSGEVTIGGAASEAQLMKHSPITLGERGHGSDAVLSYFTKELATNCVAADHPGYLAFIPAAPTKAATAFDMAVTASSIFAGFWQAGSGAIFAENETIRWLADEFGLPEEAGGTFVQGGTLGNLSALVAARDHARQLNQDRGTVDPPRWKIVCSDDAHSSVSAAASVMDVDVVRVPAGVDGVLRPDAVRRALDECGSAVFAVVATAGSTNFGTIDDVAGIARLRDERGFWLHVDGAYGLAGMLSPLARGYFRGVSQADSLIVDPHKWLFAPHDACALIYRDPLAARRAHTQRATYLDTVTKSSDQSPADYAIHLTRRARGLALWFSLATHGAAAYRDAISQTILRARQIADEIRSRPYLRLVRNPQLSIVVFERIGWSYDDYERWADHLLIDQQAFVRPSSHRGEPHLRFAIINPMTTFEMLVSVLDTLERFDEFDLVASGQRRASLRS